MSLFREEVSDYRNMRLHGEVVLSQPLSVKVLAGALFLIILIAGIWIFFGTYSRIETAPGLLVTDQPSTKVMAPVSGLVTELSVSDGSLVEKGDRIAVISLDRQATNGGAVAGDGIEAIDSRREIGEQQIALSNRQLLAERERLDSQIAAATGQVENLREQIRLQNEVIASNQQLLDQLADVMERGFVSKVDYERRRHALISSQQIRAGLDQQLLAKSAEIRSAQAQLSSVSLQTARTVSDIQASNELLAQQRAQLEGEKGYVLTAPISGRVTALQTAQGRTASNGVPMMIIVPEGSTLHAAVYAPSRAIGFVQAGQETRLLFDAFPYQRFGSFKGRIKSVSRTIIDPKESDIPIKLEEPVYRVTITIDRQKVEAYGEEIELQPGMTLQANIVLERQSFLDWLLKPLNAVLRRTV